MQAISESDCHDFNSLCSIPSLQHSYGNKRLKNIRDTEPTGH